MTPEENPTQEPAPTQPQTEAREVREAMGKRAATNDIPDAQAFAASPQRVGGAVDPTPAAAPTPDGTGGDSAGSGDGANPGE
jgi:hypothetical protein